MEGQRSTHIESPVDENIATYSQNNLTFNIYHSFVADKYIFRSKIQLTTKSDGKQALLYSDKNSIPNDYLEDFKSLITNNGFYTIKIELIPNESRPIISSIPAVRPMHPFRLK